jgi:hypothetical protein
MIFWLYSLDEQFIRTFQATHMTWSKLWIKILMDSDFLHISHQCLEQQFELILSSLTVVNPYL